MWSIHYLLFCIGVLWSNKIVTSLYINMTEFREIDSDFDLEAAVENFRPEDFDVRNIKQLDLPPQFTYNPRKTLPNRTSEEDRKLIEDAFAIINSSSEREHQRLLRVMEKKLAAELRDGVEHGKARVKRDSSGGKFAEAAKVSNLKMLRIYLAMFSNLWASSYYGGAHPLHHNVPKAVMTLFKHRIMEFFFPPVGESKVD